MDSNQRFSTAQKGRESARQSRAAAQLRNPAPYSREGIRKRLEDGSEYDDVLITEDYTKLKDFALESGFITKEEAGKIASHKADRVAALIAEGKGGMFAGREFRPDMSPEAALAKRQEIGAGYAAQAPVERQKDIELLAKMGYTPEDVAKFGTDRSGFIPAGVPIFGGNEVPIASKSFWQDPVRNLGISAYQGGVGLGATAEGIAAPARALATRFTGGDPTQFYAPNENPLVEAGTIFGSNAAESAAGFPARYAGMRVGGELGFRGGMALSGGNPLWGGVGAVAGGMLGQLGMGSAMETLNDAAMNLILGRQNAARLQQRKQEMSAAYPLAARVGEELPDLTMFGPSFKVKGFSGKAAVKGFKQAGMKGLRQGVVDTTEFAGDLAERGGESALNMVLAYKQSEDEKKLGMPGKSAWDILAEGALGAVMQGDTKFGRAIYGGMNRLTDPGMIQQAINRTAPGATAMPMPPAGDTGTPLRPGMRRFNLGGRIESGVDEDGSPIIKGARYAVYDPETRKAQIYTDNEFALEGARTRKAAQSLKGTSTIFKRQPIIQYDDKVVGSQRQILGITRDAGVLVRDYTNDGKSTISTVPLSEIRNAKINKRINEVIENQGVKPNSRPAPFMPESFTNFNPVAFPDAVTLTTDSEPIPARVVERIGGKTDASYIVALPDGTHIRAHESQINVDKFTGGEHIIRGAMKDTDFPRSLADLAPKRGGLKGLVRIGEGADAPEVELTTAQRKDYQAIASTYQPDIDAIKREPDATRRSQMLDIVQGKIANEYLATNPIPAPSGEFKEGDVIDVNLSQTKFGNKAQTAIVTDVNDYGYAVRLVDHPNVGTFTVQDANVVGRAVPSMASVSGAKGLESLAAGRISGRDTTATSGEGVPAVTRGYSSRGIAATDVASISATAKHVDYVALPENVQSAIQKRFKRALDNDEIQSGKTVEFVESAGDTQVHGQIHVHSLDNMTFQIVASTFPEGGGKMKEQNVSTYNVRYNPDTDMWDVYSVAPEIAERIGESDEAAYMAISHLKNVNISPLFETDVPSRTLTPEYWSKLSKTFLSMIDQRNKSAVKEADKTPEHYVRVVDDVLSALSKGDFVTPFNVNKQNYDRYFTDMWTDAPLNMDDPAQFARASDAGRYLWTVRNDSWRFSSAQERVNKQRKKLMQNLLKDVDKTKKLTRPELALLLMEASKNTIKSKFDENNNVKYVLSGISENNENLPITLDQINLYAFTNSLQSGQTPKAAFLNALIVKAESDASNRNVPFIGWKEYGPKDGAMLRSETQGTGWCISDHLSTAETYLNNGPFFVYYDNGRPTIAFGNQYGGQLEPPRGARDNQSVTANEARIAEQFMIENNLGEDFLIDRASTLAARNIIDGIGTIDDVNTLSKSINMFGRKVAPEELSAEKILDQLNGSTGVVPIYKARTTDYSGLTPQLDLLTELPEFKVNFKKIISDNSVSGIDINHVDEIRVSSYLDTKALHDIYLTYIKNNKDFKNRIKITSKNWSDVNVDKSTGYPKLWLDAEIYDNDFTWLKYSDIFILANRQSPLKLHGKGDYNVFISDVDTTIDVAKVDDDSNANDLRLHVYAQGQREFNIKQSTGIDQSGPMPTLELLMSNGGTANIDSFDVHDVTLQGPYAKVVVSNSYTNQLGINNNAEAGLLDLSEPNKLGMMYGLSGLADSDMPRISDFTGLLNNFQIHTNRNRPLFIKKLRVRDFGRPLNSSIPYGSIINEMRVINYDDESTRIPIVVTESYDNIDISEFTSSHNDSYYPVSYDFRGKAPAIVNLAPNTNISIDKKNAFLKVNLTDEQYRSNGNPTTIINKAENATTNVEVNITPLDYDSDLTVNNPKVSTPYIQVLSNGPDTRIDIHSEQQPDLWARYHKQVQGEKAVVALQINGRTLDGNSLTTLLDSLENEKQGKLYSGISNVIKARLLSFAYNTANMSLPHDLTKKGEESIFDFPHNYNFTVQDGQKVLTTSQLNTLDQLAYYMHYGDVIIEVNGKHEPGSFAKLNREALYGASMMSAGQNYALDLFPTKIPADTRQQINKFFGITNDSLKQETISLFDDDAHVDVVNNLPDPFDTDGESPIMLDWTGHPEVDDDGTAYQEFADEDVTSSGTPKKVSNGYKLQSSFRISVPTSQLRRYREERMKIAATHGVNTDAYKKAMRALDKKYREMFGQATSQVLSIVNKIATEQRPNVTGYQQKETTKDRIGYAIKADDRDFTKLPKPADGAPDNRLGKYKMMFNALGEDYQVDAFRVSNRAQLKTVLQQQYKYDATNAGRVAEVVDRFARAWAMNKIQQTGFRPTEIVEITGKLNENLTELGAYANPSSDMLFQHIPGQTKKETALVAQYMREFYEDRFAAFGVLDEAYAFTKKFRGAIFRTNKAKDDAIFNVIVGFASRDETTGIHEIAHALFRGMGYDFQKSIAEAMGINSAVLRSEKMKGRVPIWVEEKFAAAFEGSLRAGLAPRAKDVLDASRPRQQDPTLGKLWDEIGEFLTGARNATVAKQIASGEIPEWGKDDVGTRWLAKFNPADKLYAGNELELRDGAFVRVEKTQVEPGAPLLVRDVDSAKVSTIDVTDILRYGGRVPDGFNAATLDTLSNWLRSYYTKTAENISTTLPDMIADYSGGEVDLGQLRAEATNPQRIAFQEVMDEPRSPLLSSLSRINSVQAGLKSLLENNRLDIGNKGTVKNAYDRYGKPSNSFRVLRDVYGFDGNTAAAYYAQTETQEFKKWSENLPLLEAVQSIQVSPDIDMNKMSPEERVNYRRYEAGKELADLASDIMRDGADDNDVDKFIDLADQYYRNEARSQKEIRKAVEDIVDANDDENVQQLMSFEMALRQELAMSPDFESARDITSATNAYRDAAHTPRTGKGFVTVSFPAMESSNLIRSKNGVVLTSGVTSFDGNRQGGEYIKFKNPQVVNLEGQGIDQQKLDRIIANATKAKRDGVVLLNLRHSNTVNSALHNVAVPITRYPTKSIVAVPGVDLATYFSGGGTLEASVYESVFPKMAVEYDAEIASVYRANHGDHVQVKDVQEVDPTSLKDVQWFHASPVCKNFSDASPNAIETILDVKTGKAVVDAIDHSRPPIVTIENVRKYQKSESFHAILEALRRNGYEFDYGVYKTSKYGGGTSRERLIVRGVRGFRLPPVIQPNHEHRTWYESIKDIVDTLPISELVPNQQRKLQASGIDVRTMKTPVLFTQNTYHPIGITADKVFPSFTTSGGTYRILMPGGVVRAVTPIALRRMMGLPDAYLLPESDTLARKILANGVPAELSQLIMAPLADAYARDRMTRLVNQEMRRQDTGEEAAYQEIDERSDIPERIDGSTNFLTVVNQALVDNGLSIITARTLNFYVGKRIVNPTKEGRNSIYTAKDVMAIVATKSTQQEAEARSKARQLGEAPIQDIANQQEFESITEFTIATNEFLKMAGGEPNVTERLVRYWIAEGMLPPATEQRGRVKIWTSNQLEIAAQLAFQSQMRKQQIAESRLIKSQERQIKSEERRVGRPANPKPPVTLLPQSERTNLTYAEVVDNANEQLQQLGLEPVAERTIRFYIAKGYIQKPIMHGRVAVFNPSVVDEVVNMRRPRNMEDKLTKEELVDKVNAKLKELDYKPATLRALQYWMDSGIIKFTRIGRSNYYDNSSIDAIVKLRESQSKDTGEEAAYQEADDLFPSQRRTVETYDMPGAPSHVERIRPKQLPPRNAWFWGAIDLYNDITRLPLSGDLAFQNLQGGIIGLSNPLVGLKAFKAGLQGFAPNMQVEVGGKLYGSRKFGREQYHAAGEAMRRNPIYHLAKQANLPLAMFEIDARLQEAREVELHNLKMTNPNATMKDVKIDLMDIDELGTVDEWYSKNRITRHLPMQGQFERFNSLVHDTLLLTQFDNWVKVLLSKGYQPNTTMFNNAIKDAARVLAVSVGDIKYSTNPETDAAASRIAKIFFTAPRWLMSRALIDPFINQMVSNSSIFARLRELMGEDNPAFNLYNGDKEVAKLGQSMWLRIAGMEAMLAIMAWVFSNWYPDTEVNTDIQPGRIRIGDFQIDPMAGLIDHYKLAGRLAKAVFSVDPKDASRAEKEGIPQWMMAVKDISKELSYKASPGITFLQAISGTNDLKAQSDNFFTAPWEAKSMNVVGEPLFERSASAKIFYEMIRPRLRELFGDAVADDIPISNMMMDRIPMALPGFIDSFAQAKEYNRDPWVYALADTIPNFFGFKVDVMPTEARKDRAKEKNSFTAEDSPTLLRLLAEGRGSEAFTGTVKSSPPQGNVQPW